MQPRRSPLRRLRRTAPAIGARRWRDEHAIWWAELPGARAAARRRGTVGRPVLVIGLPRGGTSWIGRLVGRATGCAYVREPLTQSRPIRPEGMGWVEGLSGPPDEDLVRLADDAFAGLPRFSRRSIPDPDRWSPRTAARVVVKEVNPLWLPMLLERFDPVVAHVVRHPCAVLASWDALGWTGDPPPTPGLDADLLAVADGGPLERHGAWQAALHRHATDALRGHDHVVVRHEDLARDPDGGFAGLFEALGLPWDDAARAEVVAATRAEAGAGPFDTVRDPASTIDAWRDRLDDAAQGAVLDGWAALDPPWYRDGR